MTVIPDVPSLTSQENSMILRKNETHEGMKQILDQYDGQWKPQIKARKSNGSLPRLTSNM